MEAVKRTQRRNRGETQKTEVLRPAGGTQEQAARSRSLLNGWGRDQRIGRDRKEGLRHYEPVTQRSLCGAGPRYPITNTTEVAATDRRKTEVATDKTETENGGVGISWQLSENGLKRTKGRAK